MIEYIALTSALLILFAPQFSQIKRLNLLYGAINYNFINIKTNCCARITSVDFYIHK